MDRTAPKIVPLGESAVVVEFGRVISADLNRRATALAETLTKNPFTGFVEAVPAYASTTVFFEPSKLCSASGETVLEAAVNAISKALANMRWVDEDSTQVVEIPAAFNEVSGPDLMIVAERSGISISEVIDLFTSQIYRVFMIGFLPGFAYMGEVDEQIALPRKQQPRSLVPKGSIGIAGRQTGIYPLESPGGWQLIGRTDVELFTPDAARPTLFKPGDLVRFVRV